MLGILGHMKTNKNGDYPHLTLQNGPAPIFITIFQIKKWEMLKLCFPRLFSECFFFKYRAFYTMIILEKDGQVMGLKMHK